MRRRPAQRIRQSSGIPVRQPRANIGFNWWKGRDSKCPAKELKNKIFDHADRLSAPSRTPTASALAGPAGRGDYTNYNSFLPLSVALGRQSASSFNAADPLCLIRSRPSVALDAAPDSDFPQPCLLRLLCWLIRSCRRAISRRRASGVPHLGSSEPPSSICRSALSSNSDPSSTRAAPCAPESTGCLDASARSRGGSDGQGAWRAPPRYRSERFAPAVG